ncbi:MAG: YfhO family protein [Bacteroidia bacterium]|nr:YfhO family protein [Bacteroidia bacterium]
MSKQKTNVAHTTAKSAAATSSLPSWVLPLALPVLFLMLMGLYFAGPLTESKTIYQHDIVQNRGMGKELNTYREQTGKEALWTDAMFGGMPTYQISLLFPNNLFTKTEKIVTFGMQSPYKQIWMLFLGFFVLLLVCRVNPWLSFIGATAFAFSSYFFIILQAGHNTKAMAAALIAPIVAGTILAYRGKIMSGVALTLLALALQINANHIQVTYYMGIILIGIAVAALIEAVMNKPENNFFDHITPKRFGLASAALLLAAGLAVLPNVSRLWTTYEYTEVTMRGKSELSTAYNKKGGLDKEYALRWSYGIMETFNLMIPNLYGGGTGSSKSQAPETYDWLVKNYGGKVKADEVIKQVPAYWGDQPFTSGPTYIGAGIVFLFIFSLVLGFHKFQNGWGYGKVFAGSMLGVSILAIMLAWGRNFSPLTDLFFDHMPMYNKFRAVAMILMIVQFMMPFMGVLAISEILKRQDAKEEILKALKTALIISGGIILLVLLAGISTFTFEGAEDDKIGALKSVLIKDRQGMFYTDTFRALFFILGCGGAIWLALAGKIKNTVMYIILGGLIILDLWSVNKRYLNDGDFIPKTQYQAEISAKSAADEFILQDKSHHRVLNIATNTFNDALTSYYHKSVGGYHPAKMRRYQDLIEAGIQPETQKLVEKLQKGASDSTIRSAFGASPVLNMLNTKYVIYEEKSRPLVNPVALGNAWFVSEIKVAQSADDELKTVTGVNTANTAVIGPDFAAQVSGFTPVRDSSSRIKLLEYQPNGVKYESQNAQEGLAVFSEIYYDKGWKSFIDGKEVPHFRADWVLRGMRIPAGKHTIEFKFEPESYYKGESYALMGSILVLLLIAGLLAGEYWMGKKKGTAA